jgi:glycosyltransferase involved in cell wall biosynthesis
MIGPFCNYIGVRAQERTYLPKCDEVWVPTQEEIKEMAGFISKEKLLLFPNLIDALSYPDFSGKDVEQGSLLFVGNYDYTPNTNGAKILLTDIFPTIKDRYPSAKLYLVSKGLPPNLEKIAKKIPGVETPGFVPDINQYFKIASIFVSPVREGAGMLFKVLEALSLGKTVIGFKQSFRGIPDANGKAFVSVNSKKEFVDSTLELLRSDEKRISLGQNSRPFALEKLSWERGKAILKNSIISNDFN